MSLDLATILATPPPSPPKGCGGSREPYPQIPLPKLFRLTRKLLLRSKLHGENPVSTGVLERFVRREGSSSEEICIIVLQFTNDPHPPASETSRKEEIRLSDLQDGRNPQHQLQPTSKMKRLCVFLLSLAVLSLGACSQSTSSAPEQTSPRYTPEQLAKIQRLEALHTRLGLEIFGMPNEDARNQYLLNMDEAKITRLFEIFFGGDTTATPEELRALGVKVNPKDSTDR